MFSHPSVVLGRVPFEDRGFGRKRRMVSKQHSALSHFLARVLLRSSLSEEEREAILALRHQPSKVRSNHDIITPGEHTEEATLVAHGVVARFDGMRDGARQITSFYIEGDMCDLHSVVVPFTGWGLTALSDCGLLRVPHSELRDLAENFPAIGLAFWREAVVDASILAKWVGNVGRRNARKRVAHIICEAGIRMEMAGLGTRERFRFEMTQSHLADAVGLTPVHINRTLQDLRRSNFFSLGAKIVSVPSWERLTELAEFDPTYLLLPKQSAKARRSAIS